MRSDSVLNSLILLEPGNWLDDNIINRYAQNFIKRENVLVLSTFCCSIIERGETVPWNIFPRRFGLFTYILVLIPWNLNNVHWLLVSINLKRKSVVVYESLRERHEQRLQLGHRTLDFMEAEAKRDNVTSFNKQEWSVTTEAPCLQENGSDCGVFVIERMLCLANGRDVNLVTQQVLLAARNRIKKDMRTNLY